jgi:hypothetical protein
MIGRDRSNQVHLQCCLRLVKREGFAILGFSNLPKHRTQNQSSRAIYEQSSEQVGDVSHIVIK